MDMKCPVCLEPWDNDCMHEVAKETGSTYQTVTRTFQLKGCGVAFKGSSYEWGGCKMVDREKSALLFALGDMLGDDTDGIMAMTDDAEFLGYL